ncbi:unnamed protein product [Ectocarpus sp. CCAP 1310/34]|nr:unnamed protein product [Ectocarpus sp. CCAP 1310/34]
MRSRNDNDRITSSGTRLETQAPVPVRCRHTNVSKQQQPFWVFTRGGGGTGRPPRLGAYDNAEVGAPSTTPAAAASAAAAACATPTEAAAEQLPGGNSVGSSASADDASGIDDSAGKAEDDGENGAVPAAADEREEAGELRPRQARVLECRMEAVGGDETLFACLGDDFSKFTVFLESAVARGLSDELGHRGAESYSAAEGVAKRQVVANTVDLADEGVKQGLETLWKEGRLLSQESDPADVLRGRERNFSERLSAYTNRTRFDHWETIPPERLLDTVEKGCGAEARTLSAFDSGRPLEKTLSSIKAILEWFRQEFPYYYSGCHTCGNGDNNTFVGYVYPTAEEREFRAGLTEVYLCSSCGHVSRFPRYTAVSKVLDTHRGRCGEYSVLMLRLLEALGYTCRWVVDWADHVWVEARVDRRWVHVDPCEAAVDEPRLYESWGKNQTYILAFSPTEVVDVTEAYTRTVTQGEPNGRHLFLKLSFFC